MADVYTDFGRQHIAGLLGKTIVSPGTYNGNVGTGAGTAGTGDTTLFVEVVSARVPSVESVVTVGSPANNTAQNVFTYTATSTLTVTNAGIGISATSGTADIIQKSDFTGIPLLATDSVEATFRCRIL